MPSCHQVAWLHCKEIIMVAKMGARPVRRVFMGLVLAVAGTLALAAVARPGGPGGFGLHGGEGFGWFGGRHMERLLDGMDATDEQRAQIRKITQAAMTDLKAQREAGRSLREQGLALFTAATVDANAVEALRQQMLQQHDQSSRRITQALVEVSRVLTPEQRAKLGAQLKHRRERMQQHMQERRQMDAAPAK
jgi:protein CpxP